MRSILLASVMLAALPVTPASSALLSLDVFDNGTLVGSTSSASGSVADRVTSDPAFDIIDISASGVPFLPGGDLSSVTINVTSGAISTTHTLTIDVFQTGITVPAGFHTESTFTTNNLIGVPGPTTQSTFINGTDSTLGTLLATHFFPAGTVRDSVGPIGVTAPVITADAHQYVVGFSAPDQSSNDTIQLTTGIPEPSTWAMITIGFGVMAFAAFRTRKRLELY